MLPSSITAIMLAAVLFVGFFPSSLATAQLQQQQTTATTTTTTTPPPSSLSITTTPPLTSEEQAQQNRLQNIIAATTRDLNETEKQVSGVVFTPRWSDVVWVNPNSIAVLIAYCLPGEFADSGQEILGGFGLQVLESYAVDLPQGFMAWMAVVGNQDDDVQNGRRLPAAVGVICASDLNQAETRVLSPQEQQEINRVASQFTTIQNTQVTNIDQVINIINNVTEPTTTEGQPLRVEAFANATEAYKPATIVFDSKVTGGAPPYSYTWRSADGGGAAIGYQRNLVARFEQGSTDIIILNVTDSKNQTASDTVPITLKERPPTNDTGTTTEQPLTAQIIPNATQGFPSLYIRFDSKVTGGAPPYSYTWSFSGFLGPDVDVGPVLENYYITGFHRPGTYTVILHVTDSTGRTASSDSIQINVEERPGGVLPPPETGGEGKPLGGALLPRTVPPTNDTGAASATEPPLMAEAITNATQAVAPATIRLDANITGGAPPYSYTWSDPNLGLIDQDRSITLNFFEPGTFTYGLTVVDSRGKTVTDNVQIVISERGLPPGGIVAPEPGGIAPPPPIEGQLPSVPEGGEGGVTEEGVSPPSTTEEGGGGEGEPPAPPPPSDDTEEGEGTPPSTTTEEEPTTQPEGGG
jgi:hypothetical protein